VVRRGGEGPTPLSCPPTKLVEFLGVDFNVIEATDKVGGNSLEII